MEATEPAILQLRLDIAWVSFLVGILTTGHRGEPKPEIHLFLGDRYWRLSEHHERKGSKRKAACLRATAERHLRLGGWQPTLPPAVAMAMSLPRPPLRDLIGRRVEGRPPPDDGA